MQKQNDAKVKATDGKYLFVLNSTYKKIRRFKQRGIIVMNKKIKNSPDVNLRTTYLHVYKLLNFI